MAENSQSSNWWNTSRTGSFNRTTPTPSSSLSPTTSIASVTAAPFMDSSLHLSSSPPMDWNQSLLNSSGRAESKPFLLETGECSRVTETFLLTSSSSPFFDSHRMTDYQSQMIQNQSNINQLQFTNNSSFWNASDMNEMETEFSSSSDDVLLKPFDLKPAGCSNLTILGEEGAKEKKMIGEYAMKKPRMETRPMPSPLPAFKVRKEKLGDRITALQQLVSPFGKTDTATVLQEAIEYIKFLHDQVDVLSTPYLKNENLMQHQQQSSEISKDGEQDDLSSRGLCLVPIANTFPESSEINTDFWTPISEETYK